MVLIAGLSPWFLGERFCGKCVNQGVFKKVCQGVRFLIFCLKPGLLDWLGFLIFFGGWQLKQSVTELGVPAT